MDSDDRFKHLTSDPRFKNLRKKQNKVQIDERFKSMFTDEKFGRRENLEKFYRIEDKSKDGARKKQEDEVEKEDEEESEDEEKLEDEEIEGEEEDDNDFDDKELGSCSGRETPESELSSSSDESESDEELANEEDLEQLRYDWQPLDHDAERAEVQTRRLAILNLDWNNLDIADIYVLLNSIRPPLSVRLYISEFGKEKLAKEEVDGPDLPEIDEDEEELKKLEDHMSAIKKKANEYEDADEMFDSKNEAIRERLRRYQLNQLRYYYAIAEFDSPESAQAVYKELDGVEYEGSSLELDLRYVPDDTEFDPADIKAECDKVPDLATYKAPQFIASALQQTTVKFTWDETDVKRQQKLHKAYTKEELEKDDLEAYLASGTDSDEERDDKDKYKELLMELDKDEAEKKKVDVDVEWNDSGKSGDGDGNDDEDDADEPTDDDNEPDAGLDLLVMDANKQENFKFNPDDERFKAIYDSGLYNIDPSHASFKRSDAFNRIAERKREKRRKVK